MKKRLAVLISGTGSLLDAMIKKGLPIQLVMADRACSGLEFAIKAGIPTAVAHRTFGAGFNRSNYTVNMAATLKAHGIDLIAMAGFMTVFSPEMFTPENFGGNILNIHPSLLPKFKGDKAVADALAAGVKETGTTIHWATEQLDDGHILAQRKVRVKKGDTVATLHERIKEVERELYPEILADLLA